MARRQTSRFNDRKQKDSGRGAREDKPPSTDDEATRLAAAAAASEAVADSSTGVEETSEAMGMDAGLEGNLGVNVHAGARATSGPVLEAEAQSDADANIGAEAGTAAQVRTGDAPAASADVDAETSAGIGGAAAVRAQAGSTQAEANLSGRAEGSLGIDVAVGVDPNDGLRFEVGSTSDVVAEVAGDVGVSGEAGEAQASAGVHVDPEAASSADVAVSARLGESSVGVAGSVESEGDSSTVTAATDAELAAGDRSVGVDASYTATADADGSNSAATEAGARVRSGTTGAEVRTTTTSETDADGDSRTESTQSVQVEHDGSSARAEQSSSEVVEGDDTTESTRRSVDVDGADGNSAGAYYENTTTEDDDLSDGDTNSSSRTSIGGYVGDRDASYTVEESESFEGRKGIFDLDEGGIGVGIGGELGADYTETTRESTEVTVDDQRVGVEHTSTRTVDADPTDGDLENSSSDTRRAYIDDQEVSVTVYDSDKSDINPFDDGEVSRETSSGTEIDIDGFVIGQESYADSSARARDGSVGASASTGRSAQIGDAEVAADVRGEAQAGLDKDGTVTGSSEFRQSVELGENEFAQEAGGSFSVGADGVEAQSQGSVTTPVGEAQVDASFGDGADVSAEVSVGGLTYGGAVRVPGATEIGEGVGAFGEGAADAAGDVGEAFGEGAEDLGDAIDDALDDAGDALDDALDDAGEALGEAGEAIGDFFGANDDEDDDDDDDDDDDGGGFFDLFD